MSAECRHLNDGTGPTCSCEPTACALGFTGDPREGRPRRVVDVLAEDWNAPGWRDALDSPGVKGWDDAVRRAESLRRPDGET